MSSSTPKFEQRDPAALLRFLERVCESKTSYPSAAAALRARYGMMTNGPARVAKAVAGCHEYRCQFCGAFHLGHPTPLASGAGR
jgi:hypothetical protein